MKNNPNRSTEYKNLPKYLAIAATTIVSLLVLAAAYTRTGEQMLLDKQDLKNQAIQECFSVSKIEVSYPNSNSKTVDPIRSTYKLCVEDKGYQTKFSEE